MKGFNFDTYTAVNEPMPDYAPGSAQRVKLEETLQGYEGKVKDCPIVIGDEEIRTKDVRYHVSVSMSLTFCHIITNLFSNCYLNLKPRAVCTCLSKNLSMYNIMYALFGYYKRDSRVEIHL